jgi:hypothetical protein
MYHQRRVSEPMPCFTFAEEDLETRRFLQPVSRPYYAARQCYEPGYYDYYDYYDYAHVERARSAQPYIYYRDDDYDDLFTHERDPPYPYPSPREEYSHSDHSDDQHIKIHHTRCHIHPHAR